MCYDVSCPHMMEKQRQDGQRLLTDFTLRVQEPWKSQVRFDDPHPPHGQHVDLISPLGSYIPGVQKLRIGSTGGIISEDFHLKGGYTGLVCDSKVCQLSSNNWFFHHRSFVSLTAALQNIE